MTHAIGNGWVVGSLRGPDGKLIPVSHFPQPSYDRRAVAVRKLILHTTESSSYVDVLEYPSERQVGQPPEDVPHVHAEGKTGPAIPVEV